MILGYSLRIMLKIKFWGHVLRKVSRKIFKCKDYAWVLMLHYVVYDYG